MKNAFLIALLLLCLTEPAKSNSDSAPARLAIITDDPAAGAASDVLTSAFSSRADVQVLERAEIDKVLREQGISAANNDFLKIGRTLGADGLIHLAIIRGKEGQFLEFRLIAVKPGVALASERFPWPITTDLPEWSAGIVRQVSPLLPKLTVLAKDALPISIVNIRSSVPTEEARDLERQLTILAIHRLTQEKQLFVLERRDMQSLARENEFNGVEGAAFWNGCYLLDGTIDRDGYSAETLTVSARLVPPNGGAPQQIELKGSRTNLVGMVNQLTEKILANLNLHASAAWKPSDEAEQFAVDARWAYRWGLSPQARAASESAWVLGLRTKELASLRIRAYTDGIWILRDETYDLQIPALPDATMLSTLSRALELFYNDTRLEFTNGATMDEEWYLMGTRLVRVSLEVLGGFYVAAEVRDGVEDQLADVRASTRQALAFLGPKSRPTAHPTPIPGHPKAFSNAMARQLEQFDSAKWKGGGVAFEKPEDASPMFHEMLNEGYVPMELPHFVGWNWNDRKRAPRVTTQFVSEAIASTNIAVKLQGLCLALIKTPFYPEDRFHRCESELLDTIWENRDWILKERKHLAIVQHTHEILSKPDKYDNQYALNPLVADLRQRLRKEYLAHNTNYDSHVFHDLFVQQDGGGDQFWTPAQAREIVPLLDPYQPTNDSWIPWAKLQVRKQAGMAADEKPLPITPLASEQVLSAKFVRWRIKDPPPESGQFYQQQQLIFREGLLWTRVLAVDTNKIVSIGSNVTSMRASVAAGDTVFLSSMNGPAMYVAIDPESGSCREIPFPETAIPADCGFDVTSESLYASTKGWLHRYRLKEDKWEKIQVPLEQSAQLRAVKGRVYLAAADTLLEFEPDSGSIQIVASSRRQPPLNEADSLWNGGARTYSRSDGKLGVFVFNRFLSFDPATRAWTTGPDAPPRSMFGCQSFSFSDDGRLMVYPAGRFDWVLMRYGNDNKTFEALLEDHQPPPGKQPTPELTKPLHPTRWDWPMRFELGSSRMIADGKALWVLAPRHLRSLTSGMTEPVTFSDKRNATLLRFEPEFRGALAVGVDFPGYESVKDPFDPQEGGFMWEWTAFLNGFTPGNGPVAWMKTPAGLVYEAPALQGHWLIPVRRLEERLTSLRANRSKEGKQP